LVVVVAGVVVTTGAVVVVVAGVAVQEGVGVEAAVVVVCPLTPAERMRMVDSKITTTTSTSIIVAIRKAVILGLYTLLDFPDIIVPP
jgi:hypothetical protein